MIGGRRLEHQKHIVHEQEKCDIPFGSGGLQIFRVPHCQAEVFGVSGGAMSLEKGSVRGKGLIAESFKTCFEQVWLSAEKECTVDHSAFSELLQEIGFASPVVGCGVPCVRCHCAPLPWCMGRLANSVVL